MVERAAAPDARTVYAPRRPVDLVATVRGQTGVIGPLAITQIPEMQIRAGIPREKAYETTLYILAGFLVLGFLCNLLIRPLRENDRDPAPGLVLGARS